MALVKRRAGRIIVFAVLLPLVIFLYFKMIGG
jgi:hypothetical protein